jgi:hypothetical protein
MVVFEAGKLRQQREPRDKVAWGGTTNPGPWRLRNRQRLPMGRYGC